MKKFMAILLAMLLLCPQVIFAQEIDKGLEKVIVKAKDMLEVPKEFTEFTYHITTEGQENKEKRYSMRWFDKENEVGGVSVVTDEEGELLSYSKYLYDDRENQKVNISHEEGLKKAKTFLNKVIGNLEGEIKEGSYIKPTQGNLYRYAFDQYVNGVQVYQESAYVEVNKANGEIISFAGFTPFKGSYELKGKVLPLEDAQNKYLKKIGVDLSYKTKQDDKSKTIKTFPAYETRAGIAKGISATTGEVVEHYYINNYEPRYENAEMDMNKTTANNMGLTPQEKKAIAELSEVLTSSDILNKAAKYFPELTGESVKVDQDYLYKDEYNNCYIWDIRALKTEGEKAKDTANQDILPKITSGETEMLAQNNTSYITLRANAKTGEILSYNDEWNDTKDEVSGNYYEEAKKKVEAFLQEIAPNKYKQIVLNKDNIEPKENERYISLYYKRIANGIPVDNNGISVTYDSSRKTISSYNCNWDNLSFKGLDKIVSTEQIIKELGLELMYVRKDAKTRVLAYINPDRYMTFDAFTGERINSYDGSPYEDVDSKISYDDIAGHKMEKIIKSLCDRGIALEGKSFKPNEKISQIDFLRMLTGMTSKNNTEEQIYENAIAQGILTKEERNENKQVAAIDAVKYIIRHLGYKEVAELKAIYNLPFKGAEKVQEKDKGYVALAYGLDILDEEDVDRIKVNNAISRVQGAKMIYFMLNK